jgi:PAS domain-containing protein
MPSTRRAAHGSIAMEAPVWRQIVEALPAPIAVADSQGCLIATNRAFRDAVEPGAATDHALIRAIRDAAASSAASPSASVYYTGSAAGVRFDCRRLEDEPGLVALIGSVD